MIVRLRPGVAVGCLRLSSVEEGWDRQYDFADESWQPVNYRMGPYACPAFHMLEDPTLDPLPVLKGLEQRTGAGRFLGFYYSSNGSFAALRRSDGS